MLLERKTDSGCKYGDRIHCLGGLTIIKFKHDNCVYEAVTKQKYTALGIVCLLVFLSSCLQIGQRQFHF
jgi:hypothetical protein